MKKEEREEKILSSLDELTYATRKQLQIVNDLGGDRNAHRILYRMEKDGIISSIRREQKIYYLSNRGKTRIGSSQGKLKKGLIDHTLMRNDLYIQLGMPNDWKKELPVSWGENRIIPDVTFKKDGEYHFVEIDNKQSMANNIDKIKRYKDLSYVIFKEYAHHPTIIWYSLSKMRKERIKETLEKYGIKHMIY